MKTSHRYLSASAALLISAAFLMTSCAARLAPQQAPQAQAAHVARQPQGAPGTVQVSIPWPDADRQAAFAYGGGPKVAAVEVFLYDSIGNYQSALVVRNTAANGNTAGTATVPFFNVPSGPAIVTVHTTTRNLLGDLITANLGASSSYNVSGVGSVVTPIVGDQGSQYLVFRSGDLLGGGAVNGAPNTYLTSARVFEDRFGFNEMTDGAKTLIAGYGIGQGKTTVPSAGVAQVTVQVSVAPTFDTSLYMPIGITASGSTFSAGDVIMTLAASNVLTTDVLLATESPLPFTTDVVDLSNPNLGATFSLTVSGSNVQFTTNAAFEKRNLYLLRGSMVSLINLTKRVPPTAVVRPAIYDATKTLVSATSKSLSAGQTDGIKVFLRDRFNNPINDVSVDTGVQNSGISISGSVTPTVTATQTFLVPGATYGKIGAFTLFNGTTNPGEWRATYTQGSVAANANGTQPTGLNAAGGAGNITKLTGLFLPYALLGGTQSIFVNVQTFNPGPTATFLTQLFSDTSSSSTSLFASRNLTTVLNVASASLTINGTSGGVNTITTIAPIGNSDSGTLFGYALNAASLGNRKLGDQDSLSLSITATAAATFNSTPATYTWQ